jgi:hypothetical protein
MVETSLLLYQDKKNYTDIPDIIKVEKERQFYSAYLYSYCTVLYI